MEPQRAILEPLNGLRGLAAMCVAASHAEGFFGLQIVPGGHLAVDLFFVLSGFVIAHAYDRKFQAGLTAGRFFALRMKRFYPLYALGLIFAASWTALEIVIGLPAGFSVRGLGLATGFGLAFLPAPFGGELYPLNASAWSLLFELIVNFGYAALFPFLDIRTLTGIAILSWLALVVALWVGGYADVSDGSDLSNAHIGLMRAVFSFSLGALVYRFHDKMPRVSVHPALLIAAVIALPLMPVQNRMTFDLMAITVAFPLGIALIARSQAPAFNPLFRELGAMSFALYAIHLPLYHVGFATADYVPLTPPGLGIAWLAIAVLCAFAAHYWFDQPIQRLLKPSFVQPPNEKV